MASKRAESNESQASIKARIDRNQEVIKSWTDLHSKLEQMRDTAWIFRGVTGIDHYPIPSIGREALFGHYKRAQEERLFQEFKDRAISLLHDHRLTEWDWLAFAQHIGVPTRLLDWTASPMVAAFFAIESDVKRDRLIYAVKYSRYLFEVENDRCSPFENKTEGRFTAPLIFDRIRAQRGLFTIHPHPTLIFSPKGMRMLRIPYEMVADFRRRLFKYGVDHWFIYPDAQGLGKQMNWQYKNRVGLGRIFMDPK